MANKGIIYLIQPAELVGTNRYKIGCSGNTQLNRCHNGYKNGSRYLHISECVEPFKLEKILVTEFNKKFMLVAGNEYFEGDENDMLAIIYKCITKYKNFFSNEKQKDDREEADDNTDEETQIIVSNKKTNDGTKRTTVTVVEKDK